MGFKLHPHSGIFHGGERSEPEGKTPEWGCRPLRPCALVHFTDKRLRLLQELKSLFSVLLASAGKSKPLPLRKG